MEVRETPKAILGDGHPDTLTSMANLASTYWNQGRWEEVEKLELQSDGDSKDYTWGRPPFYVDEQGQPGVDILEPGSMRGG